MAFTAEQQAAIEAAIASPKVAVRFGDRSIQYRPVSELAKALSIVGKEVSGASAIKVVKGYFASDY